MSAQLWADIGYGRGNTPKTLYSDTLDSKLYAAGNFISINSSTFNGVVSFDNINGWQTVGDPIANVNSILKFNNSLYVGTQDGVFRLNGINWDTIGVNDVGYIACLYIYNNELYAGGVYNKIDTTISHGLTKWDGISWKQVGNFKKICHGTIYNMINYANALYAFGNIIDSLGVPMSVAKFDGIGWNRVTNDFNGNIDEIGSCAIFNNDLYVGGTFGKCFGSTYNFIAKYNGNTWSDVGVNGLTGINSSNGQVMDLKVIQNKLYAVGVFSNADNIAAQYIASWDGVKWCGYNYGSNFDNTINHIVEANDTIYISGGFKKFNTDSIFSVAKWVGGSYTDTCGFYLGINEIENPSTIRFFPNPATSFITIADEQNELQGSTIEVSNGIGQVVLKQPYAERLDVSGLSPGSYFLSIRAPGRQYHAKFVKQ